MLASRAGFQRWSHRGRPCWKSGQRGLAQPTLLITARNPAVLDEKARTEYAGGGKNITEAELPRFLTTPQGNVSIHPAMLLDVLHRSKTSSSLARACGRGDRLGLQTRRAYIDSSFPGRADTGTNLASRDAKVWCGRVYGWRSRCWVNITSSCEGGVAAAKRHDTTKHPRMIRRSWCFERTADQHAKPPTCYS